MSDDIVTLTVSSIISVIIGVILAFIVTWLGGLCDKQNSRKKLSRIFSFELEQLKGDLDSAIPRYSEYLSDPEAFGGLGESDRYYYKLFAPEDILPNYHFKAYYAFLRTNFEKISIFEEDTIKSIIKIDSLIEEYDVISKSDKKTLLTDNLDKTRKELDTTLNFLKKEEKLGLFHWKH
jgi:hypothetical protein